MKLNVTKSYRLVRDAVWTDTSSRDVSKEMPACCAPQNPACLA
jgi:hypothetical protein